MSMGMGGKVGVVARGVKFLPALADWLVGEFKGGLPLVLVPEGPAADILKTLLAERGVPQARVLQLCGDTDMAAALGVAESDVLGHWHLRGDMVKMLQARMPELGVARRVAASAELVALTETLELYGVEAREVARRLPDGVAEHWKLQSAVVEDALARVAQLAKASGKLTPAQCKKKILAALAAPGDLFCGWRGHGVVVAGVVEAFPFAREVLATLMQEPEAWMVVPQRGAYTHSVTEAWLEELGLKNAARFELPGRVEEGTTNELVCASPWQEVEAVADTLRQEGAQLIVAPEEKFLRRVGNVLEARGKKVWRGGEDCLADTAAGGLWLRLVESLATPDKVHTAAWRQALHALQGVGDEVAVAAWKSMPLRATLAEWLEALTEFMARHAAGWEKLAGAGEIRAALPQAAAMEGVWDRTVAMAVLNAILKETEHSPKETGSVWLTGPGQSWLLDFDQIVVAQAVDNLWPGMGEDHWLAPAHLRALNLPGVEKRKMLAGAFMESLLYGGSACVVVSRSAFNNGAACQPSRFLRGVEMERVEPGTPVEAARATPLGQWMPRGTQYPLRWSASFVETLMACPYKAYAERVLKLREIDVLEPVPDARVGGLVVHRWLEKVTAAGMDFAALDDAEAAALEQRMLKAAEDVLRQEERITQTIWLGKLRKLAPALLAQWRHDGRRVQAVEEEVRRGVGDVTVMAVVDRLEVCRGEKTVVDYKTGSVPSWRDVSSGAKPQLALEAWLLGGGQAVEYWKLRGYGAHPLEVRGKPAAEVTNDVEDGVARLVEAFAEGAGFPALPDKAGGGLLATGHCEHCALAGVCRRKEAAA
ncbi:MAG: hypothetical protein GC129_01000 [Proteobacteria bacterium]|nr:hypothetical protein [Pseudomonadota bacterium]